MSFSLPGIYLYHLSSDNLPPEEFERIVSAHKAWSRICSEYVFDDDYNSSGYIINMRERRMASHRTASSGRHEKEKLERMVFLGEVVMLSDIYGPANLFYINDKGKLICTDLLAFRFDGAKKIIAQYDQSVWKRDYRVKGGKPRPTQVRRLQSATNTMPERSALSRAADEAGRVLAPKLQSFKTLWEATPYTHDKATTEAARQRIADSFTETLEGLNTLTEHPPQVIANAVYDNMKAAVTESYDRNGFAGAVGMLGVSALAELGGTKGLGTLKQLDKLKHISAKELKVVEIKSGEKGGWSKPLNKPEANTVYKVDGNKVYHTDELGRVKMVEADLTPMTKDRNTYQQRKAGKSGEATDEGGHLLASIFDGPGEKLNLVPMDANLNKGAWKKLENSWAKALEDGKPVKVKINPIYTGDSGRPSSFEIKHTIGNERPVITGFKNMPGGEP
ncbi:DNA/RNA non-specific endonuclease [Serratia sp. UGAL515B_01]|uniref:DNA/RNA non-specific endonuclease n=1 Tax=Serratia sp. UGAL515B_01 TaxID=2986763 RepID=UPI002954D827|nr:DNA/RNA non-specific endonuclease [Serratia sp. UGAL515B_01]WON77937.1 DNA/RNA non-specific endonuclease [Serratia sp. UGAL515B_01]